MPKGRPGVVKKETLVETIQKYKEQIIFGSEKCIVPKTNSVWTIIQNELSAKIKKDTLYTYVVTNRFGLKTLLINENECEKSAANESENIDVDNSRSSNDDLQEKKMFFIIVLKKSEFDELVIESNKQYKDHKGKNRNRVINILQPGKWSEIIAKKLFDDFRLTHGYHFKNHYITRTADSGKFYGHCKCGSEIQCEIIPTTNIPQTTVKIECVLSNGDGNCGKRQCRGDIRKQVVKDLEHLSAEHYRAKLAEDMMEVGDLAEPPQLYNANVLHNAKYEARENKYRDGNAIIALSKLKRCGELNNVVREISIDPVMVNFWSPHQVRLYNDISRSQNVYLCIDATGGIAKRFKHIDGKESHHIFLYLAVLYGTSCGQITVSSCFSEAQDTVSINYWLRRWIQSGSRFPKEVVCDSSKALLNACCWAFTGHNSIESYAEQCMQNILPRTKIEIDVAHYIKNWSNSLNNEKKIVKKFYLFSIGQLILCKNIEHANNIIKSLLIISMSETAGTGTNSLNTSLEFIKSLIQSEPTGKNEVEDIINKTINIETEPTIDCAENCVSQDIKYENSTILATWASTLKDEVDNILKLEVGDDINPRFCPSFGTRLLKQIKTIPLWSCIRHDAFGYGRVPPSSAPVESEFKTLKNHVILNPMRIDMAVESIAGYYSGKLKLIDCKISKIKEENILLEPSAASTFLTQGNRIDLNNASFDFNNLDVSVDQDIIDAIDISSLMNQIGTTTNDSDYITCLNCKYDHHTQYKCVLCKGKIHLNILCSVPLEEGDEEDAKRICKNCFNSSRKQERVVFSEIENWRNS